MKAFLVSLASVLLVSVVGNNAYSQTTTENFKSMCIIQLNGRQLMETCDVTEVRDGQWRKGIRVVAPIHNYEMRKGVLSGCPTSESIWDAVTNYCYSFSWTSNPLPGNEGKSCPTKDGWTTPCELMISDNQMIRVTPHLLVQGLSFG